jgi:hypothetical protein
MAPILGIWASAQTAAFQTSYESIATTTLGSATASVTFSSIPATYTHLQIRYFAQSSSGGYGKVTLNGDNTGANYYAHALEGKGASVAASSYPGSSYSSMLIAVNGFTSTANIFNGGIVDILDYTSTNKNKTVRTLQGFDANGSGFIELLSGSWSATPAAVTSVTFALSSGNFNQYSSFALYGIKG